MYDGTPSDLTDEAVSLRAQAMKLDNSGEIPSMKIQLGLLLLAKGEEFIKKMIKDWDKRGKGEFMKGEFRNHLRNLGLNATSRGRRYHLRQLGRG